MKTVQMTLEDELVDDVDRVVSELRTTRSAFTREALRAALRAYRDRRLEERHREGYEKLPAGPEEFGVWEDEQAWGDA